MEIIRTHTIMFEKVRRADERVLQQIQEVRRWFKRRMHRWSRWNSRLPVDSVLDHD